MENQSNFENNNKSINIDEYKEENKLVENAMEDEEDRAQRQELIDDYNSFANYR